MCLLEVLARRHRRWSRDISRKLIQLLASPCKPQPSRKKGLAETPGIDLNLGLIHASRCGDALAALTAASAQAASAAQNGGPRRRAGMVAAVAPHSRLLAFLGWWARNPDGTAERGPVPAGRDQPTARLVRSKKESAALHNGAVEGLFEGGFSRCWTEGQIASNGVGSKERA